MSGICFYDDSLSFNGPFCETNKKAEQGNRQRFHPHPNRAANNFIYLFIIYHGRNPT